MQRFVEKFNRAINNAEDIKDFYNAAKQVVGEIGFLTLLVSLQAYIHKNAAIFENECAELEMRGGKSFERLSFGLLKAWISMHHDLRNLVLDADIPLHKDIFTILETIAHGHGVNQIPIKLVLLFRHMSQVLADEYANYYAPLAGYPMALTASDPNGKAFFIARNQAAIFNSLVSAPAVHGYQFTDWRNGLTILPQSLDGANINWERLNPTAARLMDAYIQLLSRKQNPEIKLGLWPISRCLNMEPKVSLHSITCRGRGMARVFRIIPGKDLIVKAEQFKNVLDRCQNEEIAILLIPELTMSQDLLDKIREKLRARFRELYDSGADQKAIYPLLIVAGSFHADENAEEAFSNTAVVLDGVGEELWRTKKRHRFVLQGDRISSRIPESWHTLADSEFNCEPRIIGNTIEIRDTPLGRIWVTICLDFLMTANRVACGPEYLGLADWIFVPAASCRTDDFEASAKRYANSSHVVSIMVNACWHIRLLACEKAAVGLVYAPKALGGIKWDKPCAIGSSVYGNPPPSDGGTCKGSCNDCLLVLSVPVLRTPETVSDRLVGGEPSPSPPPEREG